MPPRCLGGFGKLYKALEALEGSRMFRDALGALELLEPLNYIRFKLWMYVCFNYFALWDFLGPHPTIADWTPCEPFGVPQESELETNT